MGCLESLQLQHWSLSADLVGIGFFVLFASICIPLAIATFFLILRNESKKTVAPLYIDKKAQVPFSLIARQPFLLANVPSKLDVIVIGSGIGGLATASALAQQGKRVLVLEQHDVAGGCTHCFCEKGYQFDTGLHYVGGRIGQDGTNANRLFKYITDGAVRWEIMDDEFDVAICDHDSRGERAEFPIHQDADVFRAALCKRFPNDVQAIERYFELRKQVEGSSIYLFQLRFFPSILPRFVFKLLAPMLRQQMPLFLRTTRDVLSSITSNTDLIGLLAYSWGEYGEPPSRGAFGIQAMLANHYTGGGYYPVGGPSTFARSVVRVIERAGGRVMVKAPVSSILVDKKKGAYGVSVNGHQILAPVVVSDAGAPTTFGKLIPSEYRHMVKEQLRDLEKPDMKAKTSSISLFIGFKGKADELKLPRHNVWIFPTWDHDANCDRYQTENDAPFPLVFVTFSSSKDPMRRQSAKHVAEVMTFASYEDFEQYEDQPVKHRCEKYESIKKKLGERLLDRVLKEFPHLRDKVDFWEVGTPVTNHHYLGNYRGAIYGVSHTPERFRCEWLSAKSPIPNLYLTGQDSFSCGIQGAAFGGILCAAAISTEFRMTKMPSLLR